MGGTAASSGAVGMSIKTDLSGNLFVTGNFQGSVDFDPGPAVASLQSMALGGYREIYVLKLDGNGNLIWVKQFGGTNTLGLYSASISVDAQANVLTTGFFSGTPDFDPGPGVSNLTSSGRADIFIVKADGTGNLVWAKKAGGTDTDAGYSISVNNQGDVFTAGSFTSASDFDPGNVERDQMK